MLGLTAWLASLSPAYAVEDTERGKLLYENHCMSCHESVVHIRDDRRAESLGEVTWQVSRWASEMDLDWRYPEVFDLVAYLNSRYYRFKQPVECE
jgi:cytochrome c1